MDYVYVAAGFLIVGLGGGAYLYRAYAQRVQAALQAKVDAIDSIFSAKK